MALANPLPVPDEAGHSPSGVAGGTVALAVVGGVVTTEAFRRAVLNLRRQLVASLLIAWNGFVDIGDLGRSLTNFGIVGAALVDGAQRRAVAAADLFVSSALGTPPTGIDPAPFLGPSVPVPMSVVLAGPPLATIRHNLASGQPPEVALNRGRYRAVRIAQTEVSRAGNDAVVALAGGRSPGWVRHLGDQPCPICRSLADGRVQPWPEAENLSAHPLCSCVAEVVAG